MAKKVTKKEVENLEEVILKEVKKILRHTSIKSVHLSYVEGQLESKGFEFEEDEFEFYDTAEKLISEGKLIVESYIAVEDGVMVDYVTLPKPEEPKKPEKK